MAKEEEADRTTGWHEREGVIAENRAQGEDYWLMSTLLSRSTLGLRMFLQRRRWSSISIWRYEPLKWRRYDTNRETFDVSAILLSDTSEHLLDVTKAAATSNTSSVIYAQASTLYTYLHTKSLQACSCRTVDNVCDDNHSLEQAYRRPPALSGM